MVGKMGSPITTLMLRNVPRRYTQEQLLGEIEAVIGSTADFNFLHMPWDLRNSCNVGYAFLNCCDAEGAKRCREVLDGYHFCMSAKQKQCNVFDAHIQGLESNLIHLLSTSVGVLATGCQPVKSMPVIIWQGRRVRFPQVVAALQRTDAPPEQRLRGQPCGSAGPLFWSDTALLQELAPGLEAMTTRRPFASTEGTTMPGFVSEPARYASAGSTATPGFVSEAARYASAGSTATPGFVSEAARYASAGSTTTPGFVSEAARYASAGSSTTPGFVSEAARYASAGSSTTPGFVSEASTQVFLSLASLPGGRGSSGSRAWAGSVGEEHSSPELQIAGKDDVSLLLAEAALVQRIEAAMAERRLALPRASPPEAALLERRLPLPDRRAAVGCPPSWQLPTGLRLPPGLDLGAPARPAAQPAAPAGPE
ncbi:unnamed protein product, partial [Prorocentrum cordatum]